MAKYISLDKLKGILDGVFADDRESEVLEAIMGGSEDIDEESNKAAIDAAVAAARAEESAAYAAKLHDMFFGNTKDSSPETVLNVEDEVASDPEINGIKNVPDIFDEEE